MHGTGRICLGIIDLLAEVAGIGAFREAHEASIEVRQAKANRTVNYRITPVCPVE